MIQSSTLSPADWSQLNIFIGFVIAYWMICPLLYYLNVWCVAKLYTPRPSSSLTALFPRYVRNGAYLPISASSIYDRFGDEYNITVVLDQATHRLNESAYDAYSPVYSKHKNYISDR